MTQEADNYKEQIVTYRKTIALIKEGYGDAPCETRDYDDDPEVPRNLMGTPMHGRCPVCAAYEVVEWLTEQIDMCRQEVEEIEAWEQEVKHHGDTLLPQDR